MGRRRTCGAPCGRRYYGILMAIIAVLLLGTHVVDARRVAEDGSVDGTPRPTSAPPKTPTPTDPTTTPTTPPPPATTPPEAGVPSDIGSGPGEVTTMPPTAPPAVTDKTTPTPSISSQSGSSGDGNGSKEDPNGNASNSRAAEGKTVYIKETQLDPMYGTVIGVAVAAAVIILALLFVMRRNKNRKEKEEREMREDDRVARDLEMDAVFLSDVGGFNDEDGDSSRPSAATTGYKSMTRSPQSGSFRTATTTRSSIESEPLSAIWKDPEILAARVPYEKIRFREIVSRGGFAEVLDGEYHNQRVAIKRLLPENRRRMACLEDFMHEVHLLTTLDHPRIVSFLGVAWDSPRDLCVLLEFMTNGDLRRVLAQWKEGARKTGWEKQKLTIALQIAEGLTYLHTMKPKIVHRDLKSKNVLVNENWDAKLSDFGVAREESERNTMTTNVGSSLWIAPEVMMGNNYDEKADIFSFGVVLTELDTHQLPYHNVTTPDGRKVPDAAILHMVTMGKIQAEFSPMSRTDLVLLGRSCLALDPAQRPSAPEISHRLQQILRSF